MARNLKFDHSCGFCQITRDRSFLSVFQPARQTECWRWPIVQNKDSVMFFSLLCQPLYWKLTFPTSAFCFQWWGLHMSKQLSAKVRTVFGYSTWEIASVCFLSRALVAGLRRAVFCLGKGRHWQYRNGELMATHATWWSSPWTTTEQQCFHPNTQTQSWYQV